MRKTLLILGGTLLGAYLSIHLVLGSSPVQRWVLAEIQEVLAKYGIELTIESIEFSAFSPKLYLNRVKLSTGPRAIVHLASPLSVDKIKLEFQPLALISRRIVVDELILFHPQVFVPRADRLYKRITDLIKENKSIELKGTGSVSVLMRKVGVVDAVFDVSSLDPSFSVRSRSLSAFLEHSAGRQQEISVQSRHLELKRGDLSLTLTNIDVDVDTTPNSLRVNRALISGENLSINVKGTSSLPFHPGRGPDSLRVSYDVGVPLRLLNLIPEAGVSGIAGQVSSGGNLSYARGTLSGSGELNYQGLNFQGYKIGNGRMQFNTADGKAELTRVALEYAGGTLSSNALRLTLSGRFPIEGNLTLNGFLIEGLLDSLRNPDCAVRTSISGAIAASGYLAGPLDIRADLTGTYEGLYVLRSGKGTPEPDNVVFDFGGGDITGKLGFTEERFTYETQFTNLGGNVKADGFVTYDNHAKVRARIDGMSFTQLKRISTLGVGGRISLLAEVEVVGTEVRAAGTFDFEDAEIARIALGSARGQVFYQNLLLSFENIEIPGLEAIRGNGYVDWGQDELHYKFDVNAERASMGQLFGVFRKTELGFPVPQGGEAQARISIEGGHDPRGIEVVASGRAKNFEWYGEPWSTARFILTYRPDAIELNRVTLFKKSGALEAQGVFGEKSARLTLRSQGLQIQEMAYIQGAPIGADLQGEVTFEGTTGDLFAAASGEVRLLRTTFRGQALPDSVIQAKADPGVGVEFLGNLFGESLRGRYLRGRVGGAGDELLLYFQNFDFMPLVTLAMGKDITTLTSVLASGDLSLRGGFRDWKTLKGSGSLHTVEVGLRGTPLRNPQPVSVKVSEGVLEVGKFTLTGVDGEVTGEGFFQLDRSVTLNLDGKLDLQYLQPFIPVLEYGIGKTVISIRMSGKPDKFKLLGSLGLEDGALRFTGLKDEFRNAQVQLSLSQDQMNVDRFEATVNGGRLRGRGSVGVNRFTEFRPKLTLTADKVEMRLRDSLWARLSGEFGIAGNQAPYTLSGQCQILEGRLTKLEGDTQELGPPAERPAFQFDVTCDADDRLFVLTEIMEAEFRGKFQVLGNTEGIGLLGRAEGIRGSVLFRETRFSMESANVRFLSPTSIQPRFRVAARALVKEQKSITPQEYDIQLQTFGTPEDYKIVLSSSPALSENDIISLLLLGVTSREDATYLGLGTTLAGQVPLQSKVGNELGVDIKIKTETLRGDVNSGTAASAGPGGDITVPSVQIQKDITKQTKVSFSNSLDPVVPIRELRIEQILDENLSVNATTANRPRGATEAPTQSYGLDFRFRFQFD